jgi:hypothetical protein
VRTLQLEFITTARTTKHILTLTSLEAMIRTSLGNLIEDHSRNSLSTTLRFFRRKVREDLLDLMLEGTKEVGPSKVFKTN